MDCIQEFDRSKALTKSNEDGMHNDIFNTGASLVIFMIECKQKGEKVFANLIKVTG